MLTKNKNKTIYDFVQFGADPNENLDQVNSNVDS